jgi:hypothetical protein
MSTSTAKNVYPPAQAEADQIELHDNFGRGKSLFVDKTNGSDTYSGLDEWANAKATIQAAVTASEAFDTIYIAAGAIAETETDPNSYAERVIVPNTHEGLAIIGVSRGRTQGGLPQMKPGGTTTGACITVRAPGCLIKNMGFNGNSTAGAPLVNGISLEDNGTTKVAFGTTIENCHFKNCAGSTVTNAATGGGILLSGAPWQVLIKGCRFYKCVADIVSASTYSDLQDLVIEDCIMSGNAADTDCNIHLIAGDGGILGLTINRCIFNQLPALSAGSVKRYLMLTGCTGMITNCMFGCQTSTTGTTMTFQAAGSAAYIPTTVHVASCYGQTITASESGEITIANNT